MKKHIKIEFDWTPTRITGEQMEQILSDLEGEIKYTLGNYVRNFVLELTDAV